MYWRVDIKEKEGVFSGFCEGLLADIAHLGYQGVTDVRLHQIYFLIGSPTEPEARRIAAELLADQVIEDFELYAQDQVPLTPTGYTPLQIIYNPGVMEPVEESTLRGIRDMGISSVTAVRTAKRYFFKGTLGRQDLMAVAEKLLYNKLIQSVLPEDQHSLRDFSSIPDYAFSLKTVDLLELSGRELDRLSRTGQLYLNTDEMRAIQGHFRFLKRDPTDCELETLAQTWSEHCVHKTFRGRIDYRENLSASRTAKKIGSRVIPNLLKETIMKATRQLKKRYCVSVFKDNSGIIRFDDKFNLCFKVETHNHPSALEPYGGANTGIGGVIRDPLGTGMGAKPILNTDVFCFGPLDYPAQKLPHGALAPRRVMKGVVSGVRDYGNRMGIPTANGAVLFDERFVGNPLVYCGTVGILPKDKSFKKVSAGEAIVVVGGRTGRDGIHGATFSSGELTHESESLSSGAVQIGNAITEKKMLDVLLAARDEGLYEAVTDCGAGGLSSAVGEMGVDCGARVTLEKVPLKYHGLSYTEIWISEAQERMVLSVAKDKVDRLIDLFRRQDVEATVIGEFTDSGRLELFYDGHKVCDLDMAFLHDGLPRTTKRASWKAPRIKEKARRPKKDLTQDLLGLLAMPNIASKEWVIRQYDHEVQGATIIKPLVGVANDGPSDACVVKPRFDSLRGFAVSNGINFRYGDLDPYWMAAGCIDEALRQLVAVGCPLDEVAILDNFCWGNPDKPDRLGALVRAAYGCYDAARAFGVPFISGKDSFYNEFTHGKRTIAIPGTLLISAIGVIGDVSRCVTMDLKAPGNLIYVVGETRQELGGSHYYDRIKARGGQVPVVNFSSARKFMRNLSAACAKGLVRSVHDCSEGGLGVALAEMCLAGGLGANLFLSDVAWRGREKRNDFVLFSESHSRFVVEVERQHRRAFERALKSSVFRLAGCVTEHPVLKIFGLKGEGCVEVSAASLKAAWQGPLRSV
ncbi:MAG: phosphoribosylformylglycinamidine synthase subunit PurL [Candidatus Omnitrophica bacterium]|nr:phosphoribosylformylglycinamidine synthase subunit PurL [Candidatus Omnitrophota bacterium]